MFICNSYANKNKFDIKRATSADAHRQRCHGNIPVKDYEEIRSLPLPSVFQWHARALLTPNSPLQGDRGDHFHLELTCEPFDARHAYRYTPSNYWQNLIF